jgi:hypothetical protein
MTATAGQFSFGGELAIRDAREELLAAIEREEGLLPVLLVLGPSGCGKSSLTRAGIAPVLTQQGGVPGVDSCRSAKLEVDRDVLSALAAHLYATLPELASSPQQVPADWARLAAGSPDDAAAVIRWAIDRVAIAEQQRMHADRAIQVRLLLLVDQLERFFVTKDPDALRFPAVLSALVKTQRVWLLMTVRSDRYADLQSDADLRELSGAVFSLTCHHQVRRRLPT